MYDRAGCEILKARRVGGGKLERQEREREENKKTQSNEIFTSFWINTWTLLTSQLHGRGGKRNVEGQKEQWSFTVTVKGAERLTVPPGCDPVPLGFLVFLGLFTMGTTNMAIIFSSKKKKIWYDECENEGVFYFNRNLNHTLLSTTQSILWGFSESCFAQWLKNISNFFGVSVVLCREAQCKQITKEWTWVFIFSLFSHSAQQCPKRKVTPCAGGVRGVSTPPGCAAGARDMLQHPQIAHTSAPAPISHVMFETSNILSLLINTAIMACQGFMLYPK